MSTTVTPSDPAPDSAQRTAPGSALSRRRLLLGSIAATAAGGLVLAPSPATAATRRAAGADGFDERQVRRWAAATWVSMVAMTDEHTGLPADNISGDLAAGGRSGYTSPTNIGGYLWSAIIARDLGFITPGECTRRLRQTLQTLLRMGHHEPSGMYYNWYDETSGAVLTTWPTSGDQVHPFVSSVDNGWLGAALMVVRSADPGSRHLAQQVFDRMRWDAFYDPQASRPGGLMHGGFYDAPPADVNGTYLGNHIGIGPDVWLTRHHYDTAVSETRITAYIGIAAGQIPARQYFATWRTFPSTCDWSWQEAQPVGVTRTHLGIEVFEGAYPYRGMHVVPGWGGSMFEELMPDVFVPEAAWAPQSWGLNHPLHVRAQREHGLDEAGYGYWGFSPSSDPFGGYREYGVDALGLNPVGYLSDRENTNYDAGFGDCRPGANTNPTYGDGVVTPHASFLAMMHEPDAAYDNLRRIQRDLGAYGRGGFFDAVATRSGTIARRHLSLDQAMILGAVGNVIGDDVLRRAFATRDVERVLRPILAMEQFGAGLRAG